MTRKNWIPLALVTILATGAAGTVALAQTGNAAATGNAVFTRAGEGESSDATLLAQAKVTLGQAIAAAEQQTGGKAIGAGVDNENGAVRIAVEVAGSQGVKTVLVDPQTGRITATQVADEGEGHETEN